MREQQQRRACLEGDLEDVCCGMQLQDEAREVAEEHARLLTRLASVLKRARLKDVEAAVNLREDLEKELAAIGPDSEKRQAVLAQFPSWPTVSLPLRKLPRECRNQGLQGCLRICSAESQSPSDDSKGKAAPCATEKDDSARGSVHLFVDPKG